MTHISAALFVGCIIKACPFYPTSASFSASRVPPQTWHPNSRRLNWWGHSANENNHRNNSARKRIRQSCHGRESSDIYLGRKSCTGYHRGLQQLGLLFDQIYPRLSPTSPCLRQTDLFLHPDLSPRRLHWIRIRFSHLKKTIPWSIESQQPQQRRGRT